MSEFTPKEIELCHRLHDLNIRPEIRVGDWFLIQNPAEPSKPIFHICKDIEDAKEINGYRNDIILLWSWSRCREWLKERGWFLWSHYQFEGPVKLGFYKNLGEYKYNIEGQTDLEAILAVCVQVAEGGGHD